MVTVILNRINQEVSGGFDKEIMPLAADPHWAIPSIQTVNNHVYETRHKHEDGGLITYSLSDAGVEQN
jgi:hypothetical protein